MTDTRHTISLTDEFLDLRDVLDSGDDELIALVREAVDTDIGIELEGLAENEPTLIADWYFKDYAQDLAEDIGAIGSDLQWPLYHIDWDAAANDLKMDYWSVTIDGREFWGRSY